MALITRRSLNFARAVCAWYLENYFGTSADIGLPRMFADPDKVGSFAVDLQALAKGGAAELFRLLVTMTMFQRRQDQQILRVLRGIAPGHARELTTARRLLALASQSGCEHATSVASLADACDLGKDQAGRGTCGRSPQTNCAMKGHTVLLKRYGHFGKVPTSAAMMVAESGARDLADLYRSTSGRTPQERAEHIEAVIKRAWRISDKIAAMFLSAVSNPDLFREAPWAGLDWTRFVVVDSNVDLFLAQLGYGGARTYAARQHFISGLAEEIDLRALRRDVHSFNPRLVQQAAFMFMSRSNRIAAASDCTHLSVCQTCPRELRASCPVRDRA